MLGAPYVESLLEKVANPGNPRMGRRVRKVVLQPVETAVKEYRANQGKGEGKSHYE